MSDRATGKIPVLFIVGSGHCGSTLLDMLLSAHPDVFGIGELKGLENHAKGKTVTCACGSEVGACPIWRHVLDSTGDAEVTIRQSGIDLVLGRDVYRTDSGVLDNQTYLLRQEAIYSAIRNRTNAAVIVDSTKMPERAMLLEQSDVVSPMILHIVRDPRAVTWSYVRKYGKWVLHLTPWLRANLKIELLKRRFSGDTVRIRYEDLVTAPERVLGEIMKPLQLEFEAAMLEYRQAEQHQVAGNRMRLSKEGGITLDTSWQKDMPSGLKAMVSAVSFPLLKTYGYRL